MSLPPPSLIDQVPGVLWRYDGQLRAFTWVNAQCEALLGFPREDWFVPGFWESRLHPEDRDQAVALCEAANSRRQDHTLQYRLVHRDGTPRWIHDAVRVHNLPGGGFELWGVMVDMTDTHRAEEQRKALERKLQFADRLTSLGTLAAGMAHEINNPLSYVIQNLEFVLEELALHASRTNAAPTEMDAWTTALREAREGAERLRVIVRDLKSFSRPDDDSMSTVDLRSAVDSSVKMARAEIHTRAQLRVELGEVPLVRANEAKLVQVFLNLLMNAAQAMVPGRPREEQWVTLRTLTNPDGDAVVEVSDTGAGIPLDVLPRIFDPFFTTKPVGVGTGLGLSVCHGIVQAHGGRIHVDSFVGRGTTFRVVLPRDAAASDVSTGHARRVLVIDDEPAVIQAIRRTLHGAAEVIGETNAERALDRLLAGERFDVILCDFTMPELCGDELHARIRAHAPEVGARFVFITGSVNADHARRALERTARPVLRKPLRPEELRAVVSPRPRTAS